MMQYYKELYIYIYLVVPVKDAEIYNMVQIIPNQIWATWIPQTIHAPQSRRKFSMYQEYSMRHPVDGSELR